MTESTPQQPVGLVAAEDVSPQAAPVPVAVPAAVAAVGGSSSPHVTVVMCVHNGGERLQMAARSILAQTHHNLELLLVDDGSTDGAVGALESAIDDERLRILRQERAGEVVATNRALDAIRDQSVFCARQKVDDISDPLRIERQVEYLLRNPDVAGVFCGFDLSLRGRRHIAPRFRGRTPAECARDIDRFRSPGYGPTGLYRIAAVHDLRHDPELSIAEGLDYILRVGERAPLAVCEGCLYSHRIVVGPRTEPDPCRRETLVRRVLTRACERRGLPVSSYPARLTAPPPDGADRSCGRDFQNSLAAMFRESVLDHRAAGLRGRAIGIGWRRVCLRPWSRRAWQPLVFALLPESWLGRSHRSG